MLNVRTWAGKQQAEMKSVILVIWKKCTCRCAAYGNVPKPCTFHSFYSVLCPGKVMTVNTAQGLSMTKPLATQTLEGALPPFT